MFFSQIFVESKFAYLEIEPFTIQGEQVHILEANSSWI